MNTAATIGVGIFVLCVLLVLMRRTVTAPLSSLTRHIVRIRRTDELRMQPMEPPNDEIGVLGREFNRMIYRLKKDMDERINAEEALRESETKVLQSSHLAAIGEMGAQVAHEIRNPLAGISGAVQVLLKEYPEDHKHRAVLEEILDSVARVEETVRELLEYAKRWEARPEPQPLMDLLREITQEALDKQEFANIDFKFDAAQELTANFDPALIRQVLWNLAENAAQAMPNGGLIRWSVVEEEQFIRVTLQDSGMGFTDEVEPNLFRPFYTTKTYGTGLGLAICRRIMEAHGGTISLLNAPEGGAAATLTLPKKPVNPKNSQQNKLDRT